ncbi:uncharacterized protein [Dermacentor albipictus]|uniref:uncharacterized protein isoform X3 n=1 Tax=Dermacentor albipictus TaxID=60249 RepID=UPI0038FC01D1
MRLGVQLIVIVTLVAPHLVVAIFFKLLSPGRIAYFCLRSETEFFELQICLNLVYLPRTLNVTQARCISQNCCRGTALYTGGAVG